MKSFPMFLRTTGRRVVIAGGGETAAQKARLILKTDARIVLAAPNLEPELQGLVADGRAEWNSEPITAALFDDAAMAFIGTGCPGADASLHALARAARCPVNVVDQPDLCDMTTPAIVDGGRQRGHGARSDPPEGDIKGRIALVGAGPGARDLLTLRAVEYLQEADVIFYDRLVDPDVLELARRDAERVYVGKVVGAHDWPQDRITAAILAEARKGRRVVRLKSGDPGVFGRATEEIEAARAAGLPVEIVPGVTAACAAAARLGRSLTERGVADTLVLTTGTGCPDDPLPDCTRVSHAGSTTAFYMSVRQAARLSRKLMDKGLPGTAPVHIAANISKPEETCIASTIANLAADLKRHDITGCAVLLVTWPKAVVVGSDVTAGGFGRLAEA